MIVQTVHFLWTAPRTFQPTPYRIESRQLLMDKGSFDWTRCSAGVGIWYAELLVGGSEVNLGKHIFWGHFCSSVGAPNTQTPSRAEHGPEGVFVLAIT